MRNLILKNIILNVLTIFFLFFSYQISYSELKNEDSYKLNITNVNISSFPNIKLNIYFRKLPSYAENSLLTSNFTIKENNIINSLSLERLTHTTNIALVLDIDLAFGIYSSYGEKIVKIILSYMENLDKFAIFTFAPEICIFNFDENKKNFSMNNFVPDYSHKIEEIINYSIDKLNATTGKKHVIYIALKPSNLNEEIIIDKLKTLNNDNDEQIFIHILKFNIENFMDNVFFGLAASHIVNYTNGRYYEMTLKDYEEILNNLMMFIKSNYKLEYVSPQPFLNGRKRQIEVSAYFNEKIYYDQISYGVSFNMPELNFNINDNPVVYQELDPNTFKLADKLGITLSSNIKFLNNSNQVSSLAIVGFGAFDINGHPIKDEQYVLLINNLFTILACNQYISNKNEYLQLLNLNKNNQNDEKIFVNYLEDNFFQKNPQGKFIKKAGIYWTPHFKNKNLNQWVRCFNSFFPKSLKLDGTTRYAVYLSGLSLTSQSSDICFDGIQLQYGLSPTIYTENKTIFFGPEDITKSMIEPLNPRIEYQMK